MNTAPIFNNLSRRYDFLNHLFSMGADVLWRRQGVRYVVNSLQPASCSCCKVLDVACGTGDITRMLAKRGFKVEGIDISENMLKIASERLKGYENVSLKLLDGADYHPDMSDYSAITVGYGIRNFDDRPKALKEFYRELAPGGTLMILEFAEPQNKIVRSLYNFYFKRVMPALASLLSGGKLKGEFKYFVGSVERFPKYEAFCKEIEEAGFKSVAYKKQTAGISVMYTATK